MTGSRALSTSQHVSKAHTVTLRVPPSTRHQIDAISLNGSRPGPVRLLIGFDQQLLGTARYRSYWSATRFWIVANRKWFRRWWSTAVKWSAEIRNSDEWRTEDTCARHVAFSTSRMTKQRTATTANPRWLSTELKKCCQMNYRLLKRENIKIQKLEKLNEFCKRSIMKMHQFIFRKFLQLPPIALFFF